MQEPSFGRGRELEKKGDLGRDLMKPSSEGPFHLRSLSEMLGAGKNLSIHTTVTALAVTSGLSHATCTTQPYAVPSPCKAAMLPPTPEAHPPLILFLTSLFLIHVTTTLAPPTHLFFGSLIHKSTLPSNYQVTPTHVSIFSSVFFACIYYIHPSIYPFIHPSTHIYICLSIHLNIHTYICPLIIHALIHLSIDLLIHPSMDQFIHPYIHSSFYPSVYP